MLFFSFSLFYFGFWSFSRGGFERHAENVKSARRKDRRLHVSQLAVRLESSKARLESRASVPRNESDGESQSVKASVRSGLESRGKRFQNGSPRRWIIIFSPNRCMRFDESTRDNPAKYRLMNRFTSLGQLAWLLADSVFFANCSTEWLVLDDDWICKASCDGNGMDLGPSWSTIRC